MRISRVEVARRREAVIAYFRKNPKASVAKLNAALKAGEVTGQPEKMLNIKRGYELRRYAFTIEESTVPATAKTTEEFKQAVADLQAAEAAAVTGVVTAPSGQVTSADVSYGPVVVVVPE